MSRPKIEPDLIRVSLSLPASQVEVLDRIAETRHMSRSALMRLVLSKIMKPKTKRTSK